MTGAIAGWPSGMLLGGCRGGQKRDSESDGRAAEIKHISHPFCEGTLRTISFMIARRKCRKDGCFRTVYRIASAGTTGRIGTRAGRQRSLDRGSSRPSDGTSAGVEQCPSPAPRRRFRASPCSTCRGCARARPACASSPIGAPTSSRSRRRRGDRKTAMGGPRDALRLPEPAPQQAQHDAQPQIARGRRGLQAHGQEGRCRGREFPPRREEAARHRLQDARADQSAAGLCQHFRLRPGRAVRRPARLRSDRAGHGRPDVDHRPARPGADAASAFQSPT